MPISSNGIHSAALG
jgi:hypothetical protein